MDDNSRALAGSDGVSVHSGFPNPAADRRGRGQALDLNQLLIRHPASTYLFRVAGQRWSGQGLQDGDVVVVDRALRPRPNDPVVSWQESGFVLSRQRRAPAGPAAWGVVTAVIHRYRQSGSGRAP